MESTGLARFLFELASDERLGILEVIEEKPLRHAQIARRLKITDSETTRHLNRLASTGLLIWWPGIKTWRRSLTVHRGAGWKSLTWHLHSMIGFWTFGFTLVFAVSGAYLGFPEWFQEFADRLQPPTPDNAGRRIVDDIIYWLAYLHFGRINGIGIPCHGAGLCDQTIKAIWALFGVAPAIMFVTGAIMWWNRVLRPRWKMSENIGSPSRVV